MTDFAGDWSNHDHGRGPMDFAAMRRDGILGGTHKSRDGLRYYTDPYFASAISRMKSAFADGFYGAYHVLWGNRDIAGQVDWWFELLDATTPGWRTDPRFVLMTDNEPFGYNAAPTAGQINQAGDIIRQRVGKTMLAYCPPWHYGGELASLRYPLVSSNYGNNPAGHYRAVYPGDGDGRWTSAAAPVAILQYGSQTRMGSQSTCDANAIHSTNDAIRALITGGADDMAGASDIISAFAGGFDHTPDGTNVEPVKWRQRDEAWQASVNARLDADAVRDQAVAASINGMVTAITAGGGSVDAAPIVAAVNAVRDEARQQFAALHAEIAARDAEIAKLQARLAAAARAEADALAQPQA